MNLSAFRANRDPEWKELEALVKRSARRPERLLPAELLLLGTRYRGALADLAVARRRWPDDSLVGYLEELCGRSRHLVYDTGPRPGGFRSFVSRGYWRAVTERPLFLLAAGGLLVLPGLMALGLTVVDPPTGAGRGLRMGGDLGLAVPEQSSLAAFIFTHNLLVSFLVYAAGISAGFGTAYLLVTNGLAIGSVAGLAVAGDRGAGFVELVAPHGFLELSCIVVVGAAGLRLGWAIVAPGPKARRVVVVEEARRTAEILLGTVPFVVLAGLVEGFVTPSGLGVGGAVALGTVLGAAYWALIGWRGRVS